MITSNDIIFRRQLLTAWIISNKSNGNPTVFRNSNSVNFSWIIQIEIFFISLFSKAVSRSRPHHVEAIAMKMKLVVLRIPNTSSLVVPGNGVL
ncbi:hypothetical protein I3842_15G007400 [Carya illinoinensis]|uniref:Uncharacterized protein n=1 Tax=Carya illinoinensis TaxID=32201 RepID=A0A922D1I4_CARIL|nr:hypothetical protein I3842_15G007400 [Carya illinoinensis]